MKEGEEEDEEGVDQIFSAIPWFVCDETVGRHLPPQT